MSFRFLDNLFASGLESKPESFQNTEPTQKGFFDKPDQPMAQEFLNKEDPLVVKKRPFENVMDEVNLTNTKLNRENLYSNLKAGSSPNPNKLGIMAIANLVQDEKRMKQRVHNKNFTLKKIFKAQKSGIDPTSNTKEIPEAHAQIVNSKTRKRVHRKIMTKKKLLYENFEEMNNIWEDYISDCLGNATPKNPDDFFHKLIKADQHGAWIFIQKSKNINQEGLHGIVVIETLKTLVILTKENSLKTILKNDVLLMLRHKNEYYKIFGRHLSVRPWDRSRLKIKWKMFDENTARLLNL